jgi:nucleotide-binding universal stress UspA family protein
MRLLLAIDGSPSSLRARDLVAALRWPKGSAVTMLTATSPPISFLTPEMAAGRWLELAEDSLQQQARAALAGHALPLANHEWTVEQRVTTGRPADVILGTADETRADLIVLGSRGHGRIRSMLLGSVSAEVADQAPQSVLVVRHDHISRVLVATDGTDCTMAIPDVLGGWDILRGLPAVALSVAPTSSAAFEMLVSLYTMGDKSVDLQREELLAQYESAAAEMARRLSEVGIPADAETRHGDVPHEIVEAVAAHRADLVVTGSRCLHGTDRLLLGSVARDVLTHTEASVLIVRPASLRRTGSSASD